MQILLQILTLFGALAMFLYGMSLLGSSIESLAGAGLEKTLEKLTAEEMRVFLTQIVASDEDLQEQWFSDTLSFIEIF